MTEPMDMMYLACNILNHGSSNFLIIGNCNNITRLIRYVVSANCGILLII